MRIETNVIFILGFGLALLAPASQADSGREPSRCACFAPGTDESYIQRHYAALWSRENAYVAQNRWTESATDGAVANASGVPITLTYSFVPDGTIPTTDGPFNNTLHATLNGQFGAEATWKNIVRESFDELGSLCGITFVEETNDDSATWPDSPGVLGQRGDIRIIGGAEDGVNGVLAYAYFPNWGDMKLDSAENWAQATGDYRFLRNVLLHELGHAIGLEHVFPTDGTKLMEPFLNMSFDGFQDDDLRGAQFFYGDPHEANESAADAASLGAFTDGDVIEMLSLHTGSDADWFAVAASSTTAVGARVVPVGGVYPVGPSAGATASIDTRAILPLRVEIYDPTGVTLLSSATATAAGETVSAFAARPPAGASGVRIKVSSTGATNASQRLRLELHADTGIKKTLNLASSGASGVPIAASPNDLFGLSGGSTPAALVYPENATVTLTAPGASGGQPFRLWTLDGAPQPLNQTTLVVNMNATRNAVAMYGDVFYVYAGEDQTTVQGEAVTLRAKAVGGTPPYQYAWAPSASLSSASEAAVSAAPGANTVYSVTVTDANGAKTSDNVRVFVTPALRAEAGKDRVVLPGTAFMLTGAASGGTAPYSYEWSPAPGAGNTQSITTSITQDTNFLLRVVDDAGRLSTDVVLVQVARELSVSLGGDRSVLRNADVRLDPEIVGGVAPFSYSWTNEGGVAISNDAALDVVVENEQLLTLTVTDALGQIASDTIELRAASPLELSISASSVLVAPGELVELEAHVSGGVEPYEVSWRPAALVDDATALLTYTILDATQRFEVSVVDALGQQAVGELLITAVRPNEVVAGAVEENVTPITAPPPMCGFGLTAALPLMAASCAAGRVITRRRPR